MEVDAGFQPVEGTERELPAQLVLLAMGFTGPQRDGLIEQLGVELDAARQRRPRRGLRLERARGVRRRRRGPRSVADRVGDRGGPVRGGCGRPLPHRRNLAAESDPADRSTPRRLTLLHPLEWSETACFLCSSLSFGAKRQGVLPADARPVRGP